MEKLQPFAEKFKSVGEVRSKGLMIAIDLVIDKQTRQLIDPVGGFANRVAVVARSEYVLVRPVGAKSILSPHLVFQREHCDKRAML